VNIFDIAVGTECEPKIDDKCWKAGCYIPDVFLEYNGVKFGIGMDDKLYIYENNVWRKA